MDSLLQSTTTQSTRTIPCIDVEEEDIQRKRIANILLKAHITLYPPYRAQMAKTGVLDKFVKFLEEQLKMQQEFIDALWTHRIYIPADYHTGMIQDGLFESPNSQKRKSHRDDDDDNGQQKNIKKQKIKQDDNDDTTDNNTININ
ncbi:unnamed protein product [Adineta steineri]|uniref:Uncharacterized protein n=1 Tax=Adineta steineri TaxID=433720 RepID=A0A814J4S6_9BILA|nr:unnamed protein product [Adineta steineri]CAF1077254.1 unnamed protein product [Adineta steineri]